jgi:hypothetical protein
MQYENSVFLGKWNPGLSPKTLFFPTFPTLVAGLTQKPKPYLPFE